MPTVSYILYKGIERKVITVIKGVDPTKLIEHYGWRILSEHANAAIAQAILDQSTLIA